MKNFIYGLGFVLALCALIEGVRSASATTPNAMVYGTNGALALIRPCSHKDITPVSYVSGATGAAGATGIAATGSVLVTCFNNACIGQGTTTAAAQTAANPNTCNYVPSKVPMWFTSEASDVFAFAKYTGESTSTCTVTECR